MLENLNKSEVRIGRTSNIGTRVPDLRQAGLEHVPVSTSVPRPRPLVAPFKITRALMLVAQASSPAGFGWDDCNETSRRGRLRSDKSLNGLFNGPTKGTVS